MCLFGNSNWYKKWFHVFFPMTMGKETIYSIGLFNKVYIIGKWIGMNSISWSHICITKCFGEGNHTHVRRSSMGLYLPYYLFSLIFKMLRIWYCSWTLSALLMTKFETGQVTTTKLQTTLSLSSIRATHVLTILALGWKESPTLNSIEWWRFGLITVQNIILESLTHIIVIKIVRIKFHIRHGYDLVFC